MNDIYIYQKNRAVAAIRLDEVSNKPIVIAADLLPEQGEKRITTVKTANTDNNEENINSL